MLSRRVLTIESRAERDGLQTYLRPLALELSELRAMTESARTEANR